MRIKKNNQPVKSCDAIEVAIADVSGYQGAIDNILNAIECLGDCAKQDDQIAREAIANLSVVLLDLKG